MTDAKGDVLRGVQVVEATTAIPTQMMGELLEVSSDMDTHTIRVALGVVAAICPFNFPAMIPLWVLPVAVATGNTLVLKPSERDPGAAMIIAELAKRAGLPDGVFNVIHGTTKTVDFILDEPRIKAISFVGSDKAGKYIYTRGTANGKRVQANLGAKNHGIIMPDANKNHTLNALAGAAFGAAGQRCMALSTVVFVGETRQWLGDLAELAKALKVDGGFEPGADLGPLITPQAKERVERLIQSGVDEGATLVLDGRGFKPIKYPNGNFVGPTVLFPSPPNTPWQWWLMKDPGGRQNKYAMLQGRNFRPSTSMLKCRYPRRRNRSRQRESLRKRGGHVYKFRGHGTTVYQGY